MSESPASHYGSSHYDPAFHDDLDAVKMIPANAENRYTVTRADLPLSCPMPGMALWNSHPKVYLPIEASGSAQVPVLRRTVHAGRLKPAHVRRTPPHRGAIAAGAECRRRRALDAGDRPRAGRWPDIARSWFRPAAGWSKNCRRGQRAHRARHRPQVAGDAAPHLDACDVCLPQLSAGHRACALAPAGLADAVGAARHARAATAFRHHRARPEFARRATARS